MEINCPYCNKKCRFDESRERNFKRKKVDGIFYPLYHYCEPDNPMPIEVHVFYDKSNTLKVEAQPLTEIK